MSQFLDNVLNLALSSWMEIEKGVLMGPVNNARTGSNSSDKPANHQMRDRIARCLKNSSNLDDKVSL